MVQAMAKQGVRGMVASVPVVADRRAPRNTRGANEDRRVRCNTDARIAMPTRLLLGLESHSSLDEIWTGASMMSSPSGVLRRTA